MTTEQLKEYIKELEVKLMHLSAENNQLNRKLEESYIINAQLRDQLARKPRREMVAVPAPWGS